MTDEYQWPPKRQPRPARPGRHPVHAVVTALPLLLLLIGLFVFYSGESRQAGSDPIRAESRAITGRVAGLSTLGTGTGGRHYFWLETETGERAVRVTARQFEQLAEVSVGSEVVVNAAPTISGSTTVWALEVLVGQEAVAVRE